MASDHAQRKAQLTEKHRMERGALRQQLGHRPTFEQFLLAKGDEKFAKAWRYRESSELTCGLLGDGDDPPCKRDIRDFTGTAQRAQDGKISVHYSKPDSRGSSFTDHGRRIDVWETSDEAAVLAALQLGSQKWGDITITGSMEFKLLCAEVAARHQIRIVNPELHHISPPIGRVHARETKVGTQVALALSKSAYLRHKADIQNRLQVVNPSRLDWMIAIRMRVTGHDQRAIATALREHAPGERSSEKRDWVNYAERTAQAAFGARGDREATRSMPRSSVWMQVEGEELSREATTREILKRSRNTHQKSFEREI